jgi:hypothetical protein
MKGSVMNRFLTNRPAAWVGCLFCLVSSCLVSSCLVSSASLIAAETPSAWKAAAGAVAITAEQPVWMAGYAARDKPSAGKIHELFAKVLIIEDQEGTRLAVVTTDLIGITPGLPDMLQMFMTEGNILRGSDGT